MPLNSNLPKGVDVLQDINKYLPNFKADVVLDVGANIGQSTAEFLRWFPQSTIFCFEPVSKTYSELEKSYRQEKRVRCFRTAFGAKTGKGKMVIEGSPDMFYMQKNKKKNATSSKLETVAVDTLDRFCRENSIEIVSYLKIDTEGSDLDVLRGASRLLQQQKIDIIQVEAGMNPFNDRHVPFETIKSYLEEKGYYLFAIYEQVNEWPAKQPQLRRTNPVYISKKVIQYNQL